MLVNSLFATLSCFLAFVAPLATQALIIAAPGSGLTTGNTSIQCTVETSDPAVPLSFFVHRNDTQALIASNVTAEPHPDAVAVPVAIPSGLSGDGWTIYAVTPDNQVLGQSTAFSIRATPRGQRTGGAVIGGVIVAVVALAVLLLVLFIWRRRHQQSRTPPSKAHDLEAAFQHAQSDPSQLRSFSSVDSAEAGNKDKVDWERELEEQFSRARAGTPSAPRGLSPHPSSRGPSPLSQSLSPIRPQRAVTRQ